MKKYLLYNKLILRHLTLSALLFQFLIEIKAQEPAGDKISSIQIIARPLQDSILLRWAPINYATWKEGNKYGYRIFRTTILKDTTLIEYPQPVQLTTIPLKPQPLEQWKELVMKNKYAAIAAQALYGETFQVDVGEGFSPGKIYTKSKEQIQRFSIALYAAELSPEVAEASGLWFTDKTAIPGEKYLYSVMMAVPNDTLHTTDTGYIFTGLSAYQPLPAPVEFKVKSGDRQVEISWNAFLQNHIYIGYLIEKSTDGKNYTQIHTDPITYMIPEGESETEMMYKFDSLGQNDKEYYYRIRGINSFGEKGPFSIPVKGIGIKTLSASPFLIKYDLIKEKVKIYWDFPASAENEIQWFKVLRSDNDRTGFKPVNEKINRNARDFTDNFPLNTGYYKVVAWLDSSRQKESFPFLVQLTDSVPPLSPVGLSGLADTSGIVKLMWKENKENDLFGYRVFRSVSNKDEFSQLTSWPLYEPFYSDTLSKNDLNSKVYYKIMAVDQRQNQSGFSKVLEIKKPDIIPPSPPVIKTINTKKEGIEILWIESSSNDVQIHTLFRQYKGDTVWAKIKDFPFTKKGVPLSYTDKSVEAGRNVIYKIEAIDGSANHSKPSVSIEVNAIKSSVGENITGLKQSIDDQNGTVEISWRKTENDAEIFWIYRKTEESKYILYETVPGTENSFTDKSLKAGNKYYYRIKAVYKDKSVSAFSEEIELLF